MKRKLDKMLEEKKELKTKISKLEDDLLCQSTQINCMTLHLDRL